MTYLEQVQETLQKQIIPFWLTRSVDSKFGGYITAFDVNGNDTGEDVKYLVTQCRMLWGFSHLVKYAKEEDKAGMEQAAKQGLRFILDRFWDKQYGGFYWKLSRDGSVLDPSKLVYGESFAIYALSEYYLCYGDPQALEYAEKTFDLLQKYVTDTQYGGYYENIEENWDISAGGLWAGDRKSLDIHMHLMEAFTTLYRASGKEVHRRKLKESIDIILDHMLNEEIGYGYNQFNLKFDQLPAVNIMRTWNAERETNEVVEEPMNTTSYGHNVELSWLMDLAYRTLGEEDTTQHTVLKTLLDHSLQYGYDYEYGGVYRDGVADQEALIKDKEWWQNFESLVGYLNGYVLFGKQAYLDAFEGTWQFVKTKFIHQQVGESRQLLSREGEPLVGNMGNSWKGIYHTGRALSECIDRLTLLNEKENG